MAPLADLRILVVEDEVLIAVEIEERLQRLGCEIVGPVGRLESALELARSTALDGAVLDVNVKGGDAGRNIATAGRPRGAKAASSTRSPRNS